MTSEIQRLKSKLRTRNKRIKDLEALCFWYLKEIRRLARVVQNSHTRKYCLSKRLKRA